MDGLPLEWRVVLGPQNRSKQAVAVSAALLAGLIGFFLFKFLGALVGLATVFASTAELFLPMRYRIDQDGAKSHVGLSVATILWTDVKRLLVEDTLVKLSPLEQPGPMQEFRGVSLRFSGNRDLVLGKIAALAQHARTVDGRTDR